MQTTAPVQRHTTSTIKSAVWYLVLLSYGEETSNLGQEIGLVPEQRGDVRQYFLVVRLSGVEVCKDPEKRSAGAKWRPVIICSVYKTAKTLYLYTSGLSK
jgi:hypothetical protein